MEQTATGFLAPSGPAQLVAYTGTAGTIANPLPPGCQMVAVFVTSIAHVKISKGGTAATTADFALPASTMVKIPIADNDGTVKVSAIQSAAGGNLHVVPVAF